MLKEWLYTTYVGRECSSFEQLHIYSLGFLIDLVSVSFSAIPHRVQEVFSVEGMGFMYETREVSKSTDFIESSHIINDTTFVRKRLVTLPTSQCGRKMQCNMRQRNDEDWLFPAHHSKRLPRCQNCLLYLWWKSYGILERLENVKSRRCSGASSSLFDLALAHPHLIFSLCVS